MSDLSYADRAVTHRIHNNGTGLYRAIGVINETAGGDETITEEAAGFSGKADRLGHHRWCDSKAFLQIGGHRQVGCFDDRA